MEVLMKSIYNIYAYNTSIGYTGRTVVKRYEMTYLPMLEEYIIDTVGGTVLKGVQPMREILKDCLLVSTYGLEPEIKRWYA